MNGMECEAPLFTTICKQIFITLLYSFFKNCDAMAYTTTSPE